jgi:hypothetical protein
LISYAFGRLCRRRLPRISCLKCLTALVTNTSSRSIPACLRAPSRIWPAPRRAGRFRLPCRRAVRRQTSAAPLAALRREPPALQIYKASSVYSELPPRKAPQGSWQRRGPRCQASARPKIRQPGAAPAPGHAAARFTAPSASLVSSSSVFFSSARV